MGRRRCLAWPRAGPSDCRGAGCAPPRAPASSASCDVGALQRRPGRAPAGGWTIGAAGRRRLARGDFVAGCCCCCSCCCSFMLPSYVHGLAISPGVSARAAGGAVAASAIARVHISGPRRIVIITAPLVQPEPAAPARRRRRRPQRLRRHSDPEPARTQPRGGRASAQRVHERGAINIDAAARCATTASPRFAMSTSPDWSFAASCPRRSPPRCSAPRRREPPTRSPRARSPTARR